MRRIASASDHTGQIVLNLAAMSNIEQILYLPYCNPFSSPGPRISR
jgi:hypothetical protein